MTRAKQKNALAPKATKPAVRCAIYTRKSTEDRLDLEYNSLDAQRDSACRPATAALRRFERRGSQHALRSHEATVVAGESSTSPRSLVQPVAVLWVSDPVSAPNSGRIPSRDNEPCAFRSWRSPLASHPAALHRLRRLAPHADNNPFSPSSAKKCPPRRGRPFVRRHQSGSPLLPPKPMKVLPMKPLFPDALIRRERIEKAGGASSDYPSVLERLGVTAAMWESAVQVTNRRFARELDIMAMMFAEARRRG